MPCYVARVAVHTSEIRLSTRGHSDIVDITRRVQAAVAESGTTEPGGVHDLRALLDRLIPVRGDYEHNRLNHDTNSHAHQRASIVGASEVVPVEGGRLALGTWQQLVLIDFDDSPRERTIVIQVLS